MADRSRRVLVQWQSTGIPPAPPRGEPAELSVPWPDGLPLPVVGELIETPYRAVLEVIGRAFLLPNPGDPPVLALHCRAVEGADRG